MDRKLWKKLMAKEPALLWSFTGVRDRLLERSEKHIDTDTQYAFTRPIVDHMMKNYEGVLKIEGEVGNKEKYDPRSYMKLGEAALSERVKQAVADLRGVGTTLFGSNR
jgi:hypothetical protein